ncbi:MAG: DUF4145 domain-containing protein [Candidatus Binataceae bacterium]
MADVSRLMSVVNCPACVRVKINLPDDYAGTVQCPRCAQILRVLVRHGVVAEVGVRKIDLEIPPGLPVELRRILEDAVKCLENDCYPATLTMARVFAEGLLSEAGFAGRLADQIKAAHEKKAISDYAYHLATASRLRGNSAAHYSRDLGKLDYSECRTVLEIVRSLASSIVAAGLLKKRRMRA